MCLIRSKLNRWMCLIEEAGRDKEDDDGAHLLELRSDKNVSQRESHNTHKLMRTVT